MTVHPNHAARTTRITLIAAALRGLLSGASGAVVGWLISFLYEKH
jgi:hypothetical protein